MSTGIASPRRLGLVKSLGPTSLRGHGVSRQIDWPKTPERDRGATLAMLLPMSRPRSEPSAPSSLAPALLRHLRARGVDPAPLSARFGLSALDVEEDEVLVSPSALTELLEAVADALGEPFLGLRLPTELSLRTYGFAELAARSSATA